MVFPHPDIAIDPKTDSLSAIITTVAYLKASWPNRLEYDINAEFDRIIDRLRKLAGDRDPLTWLRDLRIDAMDNEAALACLVGLDLVRGRIEEVPGDAVTQAQEAGLIDFDAEDRVFVTPFGMAVGELVDRGE